MKLPFVKSKSKDSHITLTEHAGKIKESTWFFQQVFECFVSKCEKFEEHRQNTIKLKNESELLCQSALSSFYGEKNGMNKICIIKFIIKQQSVIDTIIKTIDWASLNRSVEIPETMRKEFFLLSDAVIEPVEELKALSEKAGKYLEKPSEKTKKKIIKNISEISNMAIDAANIELKLNKHIFGLSCETDKSVDMLDKIHLLKLTELTAAIAASASESALLFHSIL